MSERPSQRQTLEQKRAANAWIQIEQVSTEAQTRYGTLARRLPAMVQINGLGTTLAFLLAKAGRDQKSGEYTLYRHLSDWIVPYLRGTTTNELLMDLVRSGDTSLYRRATTEAIEYGMWLRRYVEAKDWGSATGDDEP